MAAIAILHPRRLRILPQARAAEIPIPVAPNPLKRPPRHLHRVTVSAMADIGPVVTLDMQIPRPLRRRLGLQRAAIPVALRLGPRMGGILIPGILILLNPARPKTAHRRPRHRRIGQTGSPRRRHAPGPRRHRQSPLRRRGRIVRGHAFAVERLGFEGVGRVGRQPAHLIIQLRHLRAIGRAIMENHPRIVRRQVDRPGCFHPHARLRHVAEGGRPRRVLQRVLAQVRRGRRIGRRHRLVADRDAQPRVFRVRAQAAPGMRRALAPTIALAGVQL